MRLIFSIFVFFIINVATAQEVVDIIHLKDGSFYKGNITEYIPTSHATIKLLDGRIISVEADKINELKLGKEKGENDAFVKKPKGYYNNVLVGPLLGRSNNAISEITFAFNMVNGYKHHGHHMGIGLGFENHGRNWYAPIYADYSYHFWESRFSPIAGFMAGFLPSLKPDNLYHMNDRFGYQKGRFVGGRIGFAAYSGPHFAFMLNFTYRYIYLSDARYTDPFTGSDLYRGSAKLHRGGVMIGFVFN